MIARPKPILSGDNEQQEMAPGVNFAQKSKLPTLGLDGVAHGGVECYKCHLIGHYADQCPSVELVVQNFQLESFQQSLELSPYIATSSANFNQTNLSDSLKTIKPLPTHLKYIILLETGSTVHLFMNQALVTNTHSSHETLELETNDGPNVSNLQASSGNIKA